MKKILISLCILLMVMAPVVNVTGQYISEEKQNPFGKSYIDEATEGVYSGAFDNMQKTETYGKLYDKNTLYFKYDDDTPTIGYSMPIPFGLGIFLAQYDDNSKDCAPGKKTITVGNNENNMMANQTETETKKASTNANNLKLGFGVGLNKLIGVIYTLKIANNNNETEYLSTQTDRTGTFSLLDSETTQNSLNDAGDIGHILEIGTKMGSLEATLNVQLHSYNGDNADYTFEKETVNYVTGTTITSRVKSSVVKENNTGKQISSASDIDDLPGSYMQTAAEATYKLMGAKFYSGVLIGSRSIDDDLAYVDEDTTENYNTTTGVLTYSSNEKNTSTFTKNSDSIFGFHVKMKKKWKIGDELQVGIYPKYEVRTFKTDYDVSKENVKTIKTTTTTKTVTDSGDVDNYLFEKSTHVFRLPVGLQAKVTKALTARFGTRIQYEIETTKNTTTEISGYTTTKTVDTTPTTVNNLYTSTVTETENTEYTLSNKLLFGLGWNVVEKFDIDLLAAASITDGFGIDQYKFSATYQF